MAVLLKGRIAVLTPTDIYAYLKDPITTIAALRKGRSLTDMAPPSLADRFFAGRGTKFESAILKKHEWAPVPLTIKDAFRRNIQAIFKKPILEHPKAQIAGVRLVGEPDIVGLVRKRRLPYGGYSPCRLEPELIDIKYHRRPEFSDEIQLTLYSFVLSKMLNLRKFPNSFLRLRKNHEDMTKLGPGALYENLTWVNVELFRGELEALINAIIFDFQDPNFPGVLFVNGIGQDAKKILKQEGVNNLKKLASVNDQRLLGKLKKKYLNRPKSNRLANAFVTLYKCEGKENILKRWKYNAQAILEKRAVVFSPSILPTAKIEVFLDLEYDDCAEEKENRRIWLSSLLVKKSTSRKLHQFFATSLVEERKLLNNILPYLESDQSLIFTYSGTTADLPILKKALERHNLAPSLITKIKKGHHIDLKVFLKKTIALPSSFYGLKEVEKLLDIPRKIEIDGFEALMKYQTFLKSRSRAKKIAIKRTLLSYGAEDAENLWRLKDKLSKLVSKNALRKNRSKF